MCVTCLKFSRMAKDAGKTEKEYGIENWRSRKADFLIESNSYCQDHAEYIVIS